MEEELLRHRRHHDHRQRHQEGREQLPVAADLLDVALVHAQKLDVAELKPSISPKPSTAQPAVGQKRVARIPKCQGQLSHAREQQRRADHRRVLHQDQHECASAASVSEIPNSRTTGSSGKLPTTTAPSDPNSAGRRVPGRHGRPAMASGSLAGAAAGAVRRRSRAQHRYEVESALEAVRAQREVPCGDCSGEAVVERA